MTDEELTGIEARANAATPGPWEAQHSYDDCWWLGGPEANGPDMLPQGDAEFIAHARADVPALVAEVRRLREALVVVAKYEPCIGDDFDQPIQNHAIKVLGYDPNSSPTAPA
jgi:hypothetical protein